MIVAALVLSGGCQGNGPAPAPSTPPLTTASAPRPLAPSATLTSAPPISRTTTPVPDPSVGATGPRDARCDDPCVFLATTPRAAVVAEVATACGGEGWLASELDCDQLDYERHCIPAAIGIEIKEAPWAELFRTRTWYQPKDTRSEQDLGSVALHNIAELDKMGKDCRRALEAEKRVTLAWIDKLLAGKPIVPAVIFDCGGEECQRISHAEMQKTLLDAPTWTLHTKSEELRRTAPSAATRAAFPGKKLAAIDLSFGDDCGADEGCAMAFRLVFDAQHRFIALERLPTAACPFVYSLAGAPVFEGEILRNLDQRGLEQDDALSISTRQCGAVARLRIAEEKDEITFLDSVSLFVDGVELSPMACRSRNAPYCVNDGRPLRLAQGHHLDLAFAIPPGSRCSKVELVANGHYTRATPPSP
jgi:hypothetical protein